MREVQPDLFISSDPSCVHEGHTGVEKDTGRSSIKDTTDDICFGAVTVIRLPNT